VSGETVLYLPAPLTNLDARQSMMVAQTYGKRWQDGDDQSEDRDTDVQSNGPSKVRPVVQSHHKIGKRTKGN
jgi:hypothetical protein